jgi:hypothetical protein
MALSEQDLRDIFRHTRETLQRHGFSDLDEKIMSSRFSADGEPFRDLVTYLKSIVEHARVGSSEQHRRTLDRLNHIVSAEDGPLVSGIDLILTEGDAERYGVAHLNLEGSAEKDEIVHELLNIVDVLFAEGHGD